ncbi:two-component sensor histidine kinase [Paenibacillus marchantiophytorum]|uniref:histidine kinase n=1 Tax=Paenibacillus marchantiophytorum TaxID=1619310 RepID=A0ABQ2BSB6_9BACL|nr:HAMP domain-containing sensor histidine kinase [Paenibacillus marchantiophytorum]GGI44923.1 two-component sensor histidine kinase [Paenibacillus marchantiophytorum]
MKIKRRLTLKFVFQLTVAGMVVLLIAGITLYWMKQRFVEISVTRDFASVGLERLVESSVLEKEGIRFAPNLLEQVKQNKGWLQSLDENGDEESSYYTPNDVPKHYRPGELVAYWTGVKPFPYQLALLIQQKNGRLYTLVYGAPNLLDPLLKQVSEGTFPVADKQFVLPDAIAGEIKAAHAYFQLLDPEGLELASYNKPNGVPSQYTVQEMALRTLYSERYGFHMRTLYDEQTGRTWLVGEPNKGVDSDSGTKPWIPEEYQVVFLGLAVMFTVLVVLFVLLSLWQAHRFGAPMLHMLVWLDSIGNAVYQEPVDRRGFQRSRTPAGKWRRRYRVYADMMVSIAKLSATLQKDQAMREQSESMREEWLAGITHDLKTPLSSITGYAHLLVEPSYDWSQEEVRKFSALMLDKSGHMDNLINDLAMTYRLKTGILPPETTEVELNAWLQQTLVLAAADPAYGKQRIVFHAAQTDVMVRMYTPWLERVVNNLTANSLLHNPPDTILTVSLLASEDRSFTIRFADDGDGMDETTLSRLFERYYRGTDTASTSNGSGLGMAISKGLIEAMGGRISVETQPGQGTIILLIWNG